MSLTDQGCVIGIDVGYSRTKRSTGFCVLWWDTNEVRWSCQNAGTELKDRQMTVLNMLPNSNQEVLCVAVDGPLRPQLSFDPKQFRAAESLLSRGRFQSRGKPGATSGGSGPQLHWHATKLAQLALGLINLAPARYRAAIHDKAIVEAFPNLFLGVLLDEFRYPPRPKKKRKWTDTLYPLAITKLQDFLQAQLPGRKINGNWSRGDHEEIACLVCALAALGVAAGEFVAVGSNVDGYIVLPPSDYWGQSVSGSQPWAERELRYNIRGIGQRFQDPVVYNNDELWMK